MRKKTVVFVCLVLVCSMVVPTVAVVAKKPPNGPPETPPASGTIFFTYNGWICTIKGDGTQMTYLTELAPGVGRLSNIKHGGHYWFIDFEPVDGTYPDGIQRQEMYAVRDDNTMTIQLTDDATLATSVYSYRPTWGPDDSFISWTAKEWAHGESGWDIVDAGIYKQEVKYDADNNIVGMVDAPTKVWDLTMSKLHDGNYYPDSRGHYWSPDGTQFVHGKPGLYIVDLDEQSESYMAVGHDTEWSPDGTRLTYAYNGSVSTIKVDGTSETVIRAVDEARGKDRPDTNHNAPSWSPDSKYIAYYSYQTWFKRGIPQYDSDIYYMDLNTGKEYCLTEDLNDADGKWVKAWR